MKTEYGLIQNIVKTIHYATGGLITPQKSEFNTLCGRKFSQGHSEIMQSGYTGAQNITCEDCRHILEIQKIKDERTWYEVTNGHGSNSFSTFDEAELYLKDMRRGFPKNEYMSEENRAYHKKWGKKHYIAKITQETKYVSH